MRKILFFIIIILLISSCNNRSNVKNKVVVSNDVIKIDLPEKWIEKYTINNSIIIPLETKEDFLLGWILNVKAKNNTIYVLDQFRKKLFLYNLKGKIKGAIDNRGKGPFEYLRIKDFQIYKDYIYLLDVKKILVFDKNTLKAVDEFKLGETYPYSLMVGNSNIILSTDCYPYGNILNFLPKQNINMAFAKKHLNSTIRSNNDEVGLVLGGYKFHPVPNTSEALFHYTFSNFIYTVSDTSYRCSYKINFIANAIPDNVLIKGPHEINHYMRHHKYTRIYKPYKYKNTIAIDLATNIEGTLGEGVLVNTKDKTILYKKLVDCELETQVRIVGVSDKGFIGFVSSSDLNAHLEEIKDKKGEIKHLSKNEKLFLKLFKKDCNPCLIIFNFEEQL